MYSGGCEERSMISVWKYSMKCSISNNLLPSIKTLNSLRIAIKLHDCNLRRQAISKQSKDWSEGLPMINTVEDVDVIRTNSKTVFIHSSRPAKSSKDTPKPSSPLVHECWYSGQKYQAHDRWVSDMCRCGRQLPRTRGAFKCQTNKVHVWSELQAPNSITLRSMNNA
jgi:hypothetical protein